MLRKWAKVPSKIGRVISHNIVECFVKGGTMEIGNKILELRKQQNLSQEQLAEKMKVSRQTISKWELGETSPDLEQSKQLSKIFNVSLDDLTNNDIKNILITKVSNTEKMTKIIINILKIILLAIVIIIVVQIATIFFNEYFDVQPVEYMQNIECTLNGKEYEYQIWQTNETPYIIDKIVTKDNGLNIDTKEYINFEDTIEAIKEDIISRGGSCN